MEKQNVTILGCGRWGTFLGWYQNYIGNNSAIWGLEDSPHFQILKKEHKNEYVSLPNTIELTSNLTYAISRADIIIISISSQAFRSFLSTIDKSLLKGKKIVLCMKGIEEATGKRLSEVAIESGIDENNLAVWLGPGHIQEFVKEVPNCMIIDSHNHALTKELVEKFNSKLIRFYYGNDIIGNEIGAATKNVIGIAAGMLDGLGYTTLKGPLMARGVREVARLMVALGGKAETAYSLSHLGDYETTLFCEHSQNKTFGEKFIKKQPYEKLAEGVMTTKAVKEIADRLHIDMPITSALYSVLFENADPALQLEKLLTRSIKKEFES
ncbi:MAG: NAD(P)H-dependent glycerol-3-phosphate dehydrogenase [Clostridia bacterium]